MAVVVEREASDRDRCERHEVDMKDCTADVVRQRRQQEPVHVYDR